MYYSDENKSKYLTVKVYDENFYWALYGLIGNYMVYDSAGTYEDVVNSIPNELKDIMIYYMDIL